MNDADRRDGGLTRKQLLGTGAGAAAAALLSRGLGSRGGVRCAQERRG